MVLEYTSVKTVIANMSLGNSLGIANGDIIEYAGQALDLILKYPSLDDAVIFLAVVNNKVKVPVGTSDIVQIAKYNTELSLTELLNKDALGSVCPTTIHNEVVAVQPDAKDCKCFSKSTENPLKVKTVLPHFEIIGLDTRTYQESTYYKSNFIPMYLTTNTMFLAGNCDGKVDNIHHRIEYQISGGNITTSFKEGIICLSVKRQKVDETGFPMIPQEQEVISAIEYYIKWKYFENECSVDWSNSNYRNMLYNKEMYDYYSALAYSNANAKHYIAKMENFTASDSSLIRNEFSYANMFNDLTYNFK